MLTRDRLCSAARRGDEITTERGFEHLVEFNRINLDGLVRFGSGFANYVVSHLKKDHHLASNVNDYFFGAWADGFFVGLMASMITTAASYPTTGYDELLTINQKVPSPLETIAARGVDFADARYLGEQRALRVALDHAGIDPCTIAQRESERVDLPDESRELLPVLTSAWITGFALGLETTNSRGA